MLVAAEKVAGIYFVKDVSEGVVVAVGYDGSAISLEASQVVDHSATEEGCAVI